MIAADTLDAKGNAMADLYVISGMTGMTGNELARQLLGRGDHIIGFDNFFASAMKTIEDIKDDPNLQFFPYDLDNAAQMAEIAYLVSRSKDSYDRVVYINCAAVVHTEYFYHVDTTFDTNVVGMRRFLEQAISLDADTFINCSTSEVYSMHSWEEGGVSESSPVLMDTAEQSQRTSYAAGKLMTEFFMKDAVDRGLIKGCSIRFANVYSKNERFAKHIIPHILNSLEENGQVVLLENSKVNKRTFLHNFDSCAAVIALSDTPEALDGTVYNVATDEEISILDLVDLCADSLSIENPKITFEGFRESDPERRGLSTEKLRTRTSWQPRISLREGIDQCVECMRG